MSSADALRRRHLERNKEALEIIIMRRTSDFKLKEILSAMLFKYGFTETLESLSECATGLAESFNYSAKAVAGTTQLAPNSEQRLDEYYQAEAGRLEIAALGLNTVKQHYQISKNEPVDQVLAQLELETAQDAIDREAYQHHINSRQ